MSVSKNNLNEPLYELMIYSCISRKSIFPVVGNQTVAWAIWLLLLFVWTLYHITSSLEANGFSGIRLSINKMKQYTCN